MSKDYFGGTVKAGVLTFDDPLRWKATLGKLAGHRVTITVRREQQRRTTNQNAWYWSSVGPLALFSEWTGYEKDEAHDLLKSMFLKVERVLPSGEVVETIGSTASMSIEEFSAYCDRVVRFLAEHGMCVPEPGQRMEASL